MLRVQPPAAKPKRMICSIMGYITFGSGPAAFILLPTNSVGTSYQPNIIVMRLQLSVTFPPCLPREVTMSSLMTYNCVRTPYGAHHLVRPSEGWTNASRWRVHIQTPGVQLSSPRHDEIHWVWTPNLVYWKGRQITQDPNGRLPASPHLYDV